MDLQSQFEARSASVSTKNTTGSALYAGAFFPRASGFNIHGGVFTSNVTNNVYNLPLEQSFDFRTIRLGDVKLVKEVCLSPQSAVVGRQSRGVGVRRMYHAEIRRDPGTVTVALYQGVGAEEEWRYHVAKYESIRHPNIMQLYGLVSTQGLYAMVFHDELIPYAQFLRRFEHSPVLSTYIIGYCSTEFVEATNYVSKVFRKPPIAYYDKPSVWIRHLTGELCLDFVEGMPRTGTGFKAPFWRAPILRLENVSLDAPDSETIIISSLSETQFHELYSGYPSARFLWFQRGTCARITEPLFLPEEELCWNLHSGEPGELLPNSWVRYDSRRICALKLELPLWFLSDKIQKAWLPQANCIFTELQEVTHVEDYVCVDEVRFMLRIAHKRHIDAEGYLFVCPPRDFRTGNEVQRNLYQWPDCPAYWSLDPSGTTRLRTDEARILGFPTIHIETVVLGRSWDCSVYKGLRRFYKGKGFNPDSREVAKRLGYPLYKVLRDVDSGAPFPAYNGE
ncbi:hypothetical protein MSAN_02275300 [Mycena sanguinolenta]|uniref:Protein kinase domain-containing protein n=1 Tax=Mycena sanguinolenta TaxID=230812 RepID=A0A8H6XAK9_9AGAR|nr:hypothetical protein MSAN_02275300 [Mycena sanguinolenta]